MDIITNNPKSQWKGKKGREGETERERKSLFIAIQWKIGGLCFVSALNLIILDCGLLQVTNCKKTKPWIRQGGLLYSKFFIT